MPKTISNLAARATIAVVCLVVLFTGVRAQPNPDEITLDQLRQLQTQAASNEALPEEVLAQLARVYDGAIADITARNEWRTRKKTFDTAAAAAPDLLTTVRAQIDSLPAELPTTQGDSPSLEDAQAAFDAATAEQLAASTLLSDLKAEQAKRDTARKELPDKIAQARQRTTSPIEDESLAVAEDDPPELKNAIELGTASRRANQTAELASYEAELNSYIQRSDLILLRIELADRSLRLANDLVTRLRKVLEDARSRDADRQAAKAEADRRKAAQMHPVVAAVAEANAELAKRRTGEDGLPALIAQASTDLAQAEQLLKEVTNDFEGIEERIKKVGMTDAVGLLLRRKRGTLPQVSQYEDRISEREETLSTIQLEFLDVDDRLRAVQDLDAAVAARMNEVPADFPDRASIEASLRAQLESQRTYLEALRGDYDRYTSVLVNLDSTERQLVDRVIEYRDYIDQRVLWIRSTGYIRPADLEPAGRALAWLLSPQEWSALAGDVGSNIADSPFSAAASLLILLVVLGLQPLARVRIRKTSEVVAKNKSAPFLLTLRCFAWTLVASTPLPAVLWLLSWRISAAHSIGAFGDALVAGLLLSALPALALSFARHATRSDALAQSHFDWPDRIRVPIRRHLTWFMPVVVSSAFVFGMVSASLDESRANTLGRLVLLGGVVSAIAFTHLMLRPNGPLFAPPDDEEAEEKKPSPAARAKVPIYLLALLVPLAIGALSVVGYTYTSGQLIVRYAETGMLLVGIVLFNELSRRWFDLSEQRIARTVRKRKLRRKADKSAATEEVDDLDLKVVREQTRSLRHSVAFALFGVGVLFVWLDVLPALGFLDEIELWRHTVDQTDAEGNVVASVVPVTLGRVLLAVAFAALTVVITRTVPGFLETTILQRLKLSPGIRYAFKSISRYVFAAVGAVVVFNMIGIGWSQVQWLIAGFSVGLGFGLQEIFANFVSGLILLIERPIRVGDTVTVNGITGRVTRINMRATTVEDWDSKELVVPNKAFITTEIVNWSLSSENLRLVLKVGVAYGSDVKLVEDTLLRVAREQPKVLSKPAPNVMFQSFGDSTLDFELRCFVSGIENFRFVRHEVNKAIDEAFRHKHIEIAFPQRVLHVRNFEQPLRVSREAMDKPAIDESHAAETGTEGNSDEGDVSAAADSA